MKIIFTSLLFTGLLFSSESYLPEDEIVKMKAEFEVMKQEQLNGFDQYKKDLEVEYKAYKNELEKYWKNPKLSSQKEWVSYSQDNKSRLKVDFENEILTVEVIAKNKEEAQKLLEKRLSYVVSKDTKEIVESDPLQKKIANLPQTANVKRGLIDSKPILENVIFEKKPSPKELQNYTKEVISNTPMKIKKSKISDEHVYSLSIELPQNTTLKRSQVYKEEIVKNASRFEIPVSLVFAIMETESNFNPFAKSHIPAFGLMQIVPKSAGRDVYRFLYKKDGMPSASYLYNSSNNIEMGSTYLHILYYRYLRKINNPQSRLYCSIAAYNTGAGNIAWAFTRKYNINTALSKINTMTPDEVYSYLLLNLKYDEPKHYLKRVKQRMQAYEKAYQL